VLDYRMPRLDGIGVAKRVLEANKWFDKLEKMKVIGCKITKDELQNLITPIMHDCYQLGLINHDTVYPPLYAFASTFGLGTTT
jgi:CheY-like chemotaxis protein